MQRSPIADAAAAAGVRLRPYQEWEVPAVFSRVQEEYRAACATAAVADLSHRGVLRVAGPERTAYLQSMLSNEVKDLRPGDGNHTTLLTPQGRLLGDMGLLCGGDEVRLLCEPLARQPVFELLAKYGVLSDVEVEDVSAEYAQLAVLGPQAVAALGRAGLAGVSAWPSEPWRWVAARWRKQPVTVVRSRLAEAGGFELLLPRQLGVDLWTALGAAGVMALGFEALNLLRLEAGVPLFGIDFDHTHLPVEANLLDAISYTKGCYVGQEVLARLRARGHVSRRLSGLVLEGDSAPPAGATVLHAGENVGEVTSGVFSPKLGKPIALAYVRWKTLEEQAPLTVVWEGNEAAAVVEPPFSKAVARAS